MEHSKDFDKIKGYYEQGFWTIEMVRKSAERGLVTLNEFEEITGEIYEK